jgi:hypothetical protein
MPPKNDTKKKDHMFTMPLHIVLLALLLLSIPQALSEPILSFPPRSPPFQMEFAFDKPRIGTTCGRPKIGNEFALFDFK